MNNVHENVHHKNQDCTARSVTIVKFFCRKICIWACSGKMCDLSRLTVSPAVENTLSWGVDDAWIHSYELESSDRRGSVSRLFHHQASASSDVGTAGCFLYSCISCWTLSGMRRVFSAAALLFRPRSSSSKNSSRAVNLGFLASGVWQIKM